MWKINTTINNKWIRKQNNRRNLHTRKESRRNIIRYRIYVTKRLSIRMENNMEQCNARIRTKRNKNL